MRLTSRLPVDSARVRDARIVFVVLGLAMTAVVASAQGAPAKSRIRLDTPRVSVSRHELRVVFPRDTAHRWGWSVSLEQGYRPRYSWDVDVATIEGQRTLRFAVSSVSLPREYASLRELLAAARGYVCNRAVDAICTEIGATASVEDGHPVFTVRDSGRISWLFAMQPAFVQLAHDRPDFARLSTWDSVRVAYRAPNVAPLDPAILATAHRARRRESLERFRVTRGIGGGGGLEDGNMIVVGDSVPLWLHESQWSYDIGGSGRYDLTDSGWTVLDPRVARLQRPSAAPIPIEEPLRNGPPRRYLKALRPGTTTIRVRGVHGMLDAALDSESEPGVLERTIIVGRPPRRLEITPRPDTLRRGDSLSVRVRVVDTQGEHTDRVALWIVLDGNRSRYYYDGIHPTRLWIDSLGRQTFVARLGALTDTLSVVVVDSAASPSVR